MKDTPCFLDIPSSPTREIIGAAVRGGCVKLCGYHASINRLCGSCDSELICTFHLNVFRKCKGDENQ